MQFTDEIFIVERQTGGVKPKSGGATAPLHQPRTATGSVTVNTTSKALADMKSYHACIHTDMIGMPVYIPDCQNMRIRRSAFST